MRQHIVAIVALCTIGAHLSVQPVLAETNRWLGHIGSVDAAVFNAPNGEQIGWLAALTPVTVSEWLHGPELTSDNATWAAIGDGRFVHSSMLQHAPLPSTPPPPPRIASAGHWADANLTEQILTLYDGPAVVSMALMNSGRPGGPDTETHLGEWPIVRRVANETMRGPGYAIPDVLFTQYFSADGEAIHLNYWLSDAERGVPRSHGCLGLAYADALFAWQFLDIGSVVYIHN